MLPNCLIVGTQKSGTSWIADRLSYHLDVFVCSHELQFFNVEEIFSKGFSWYEAQFAEAEQARVILEKTPGYAYYPIARQRIRELMPDTTRYIITFRDPVKRSISAVNHHKRKGRINPLLNLDRLFLGIVNGEEAATSLEQRFQFLDRSRYAPQLKSYLDDYGDRVLPMIFETDIAGDPERGISVLCDFLELDRDRLIVPDDLSRKINEQKASVADLLCKYYLPGPYPLLQHVIKYAPQNLPSKKLHSETIAALHDYFAEDCKQLASLLGKRASDLTAWELPITGQEHD